MLTPTDDYRKYFPQNPLTHTIMFITDLSPDISKPLKAIKLRKICSYGNEFRKFKKSYKHKQRFPATGYHHTQAEN